MEGEKNIRIRDRRDFDEPAEIQSKVRGKLLASSGHQVRQGI